MLAESTEISYVRQTHFHTRALLVFHTTIHATRIELSATRRSAPPVPNHLPDMLESRAQSSCAAVLDCFPGVMLL